MFEQQHRLCDGRAAGQVVIAGRSAVIEGGMIE